MRIQLKNGFLNLNYAECDFPIGKNYLNEYKSLKDKFIEIQKEVEVGATLKDGTVLTDHGPNHIIRVIQIVSYLLKSDLNFTCYEIYILLIAIQIHDIGNLLGRENHETSVNLAS